MGELSEILTGFNNRQLLVRMLTYAIRCPAVATAALPRLEPTHFNEMTQLEFAYTWLAARLYWQQHGSVPPDYAVRDIAILALQKGGYDDPIYHASVNTLVNEIYDFHEDEWNVEYGKQLLDAFFNTVYSEQLQLVAANQVSRSEMLRQLEQQHDRLHIDDLPTMDPFDLDSNPPDYAERVPTGVTPVDILLGGGISPTECYGILGPSGGGKTLLALQITGSMAKRGMRIAYFSYEQPAKDVQPRLLSYLAEVPSDEIRDKKFADVKESYRNKVIKAAQLCKGRVTIIDRASAGDNVAEIDMYIKQQVAAGQKPHLVVIDWLWPLVTRIVNVSNRKNRQERIEMQSILDQFKSMAARYEICMLILHQLSTESVKKSPSHKPQWFNSAEAGAFAWLLHYCFAIGMADSSGYCWLVGSKARNAARTEQLIKLNGPLNRFQPVDKDMTYDPSSKKFVSDDELSIVPGVRRQSQVPDEADETDNADSSLSNEEQEYAGDA